MGEQQRLGWRDGLVPAGLLVLGAVEMVVLGLEGWQYGIVFETVSAALLVWRRRWPVVAPTLASVVLFLTPWVGPQLDDAAAPILFWAVAIFSMARWAPDLRGLVGLGVTLVAALVDYAAVDARAHNFSDVVFMVSLVTPPFVVGRIARRLSDRAELLQRNQELVRGDAVRAERDRIAREMHDVIAHSISAMVVQTAAAEDLVRTDPDRAANVLGEVAATGRRALVETGKLLHVLRDEADEMALGPAPGVEDLPTLVKGFRDSGLDVQLDLPEALPPLSPGLDVSVYRIVQEALTNALKHGCDDGQFRVSVTVPVETA